MVIPKSHKEPEASPYCRNSDGNGAEIDVFLASPACDLYSVQSVQSSQIGLCGPHDVPYEDMVPVTVAPAEAVFLVLVGLVHSDTLLGSFAEEAEEYSSNGTSVGLSSAPTEVTAGRSISIMSRSRYNLAETAVVVLAGGSRLAVGLMEFVTVSVNSNLVEMSTSR
ncbi:hypothetical protein BGZ60DRAFT_430583 [Tricladium varicosporioides]|nr:hypothetical protein BGZ60DRAFT_430583 [Hymenoscyphus varicosporioides]